MGWFGRGRPVPARMPTRWTLALWEAAVGGLSERFDATMIVRARSEVADWNYGNRQLSPSVTYRGSLDREPGDPLGLVPVNLQFETGPHPDGLRHADAQTLGLVYTGAFGNEREGHALLSVRVWGDEAGAAVFGAAFDRALTAGDEGLRVWLFAPRRASPIKDTTTGFAVVQPLHRVLYEHVVQLDRCPR